MGFLHGYEISGTYMNKGGWDQVREIQPLSVLGYYVTALWEGNGRLAHKMGFKIFANVWISSISTDRYG